MSQTEQIPALKPKRQKTWRIGVSEDHAHLLMCEYGLSTRNSSIHAPYYPSPSRTFMSCQVWAFLKSLHGLSPSTHEPSTKVAEVQEYAPKFMLIPSWSTFPYPHESFVTLFGVFTSTFLHVVVVVRRCLGLHMTLAAILVIWASRVKGLWPYHTAMPIATSCLARPWLGIPVSHDMGCVKVELEAV